MNELALFSGIGGISLGLKRAIPKLKTLCHVEYEPFCVGALISKMEKGLLDSAPIWGDIRTFEGRRWRGIVDIISGGFPCQDISNAGKGKGLEGSRSGLWFEMLRIIGEVRPRFVFVENVAALLTRGTSTVLGTLSEIGYDSQWRIISAQEVGAPHQRKRIFIVAYRNGEQCMERTNSKHSTKRGEQAFSRSSKRTEADNIFKKPSAYNYLQYGNRRRFPASKISQFPETGVFQDFALFKGIKRIEDLFKQSDILEPFVRRSHDGIPFRLDRIRALGNAVVPQCAEKAAREMILPFLQS